MNSEPTESVKSNSSLDFASHSLSLSSIKETAHAQIPKMTLLLIIPEDASAVIWMYLCWVASECKRTNPLNLR